MENESLFSERQSIRDSARQLKKYGSTCNHVRNNEFYIRHNLEQSDTLQGLALKYGCTMEQIRRANRLFAQDSLFLRQYLMIPVDRETSVKFNENKSTTRDDETATATTTSTASNDLPKKIDYDTDSVLSPDEESKKSIEDFLGKIDLTLAKTKKFVRNNSQNSANLFMSLDDSLSPENAHSSAAYALSSSYHTRNGSYNDNGYNRGTPMTSQSRRVNKTMHHRLEEQQDEFFEL